MPSRNLRFKLLVLFLIAAFLISIPVRAGYGSDANDLTPSTQTNQYVFQSDQNSLIQSGGIAGIRRSYSVKGKFDLTIDFEAGKASFINVDANAIDESSPPNILDPNEVFNMTLLEGLVINDTRIEFTGQADDRSDVNITATFQDDLIHLIAETIPPPNSADFFIFEMDAVAQRKYNGGTGEPNNPYLIHTAEQMNNIGTEPNDWDKHFKLTADIDIADFDGKDGRQAFNIIAPDINLFQLGHQGTPFTGVFDGNFHTISNFSYTFSGSIYDSSTGIFGMVRDPNALIQNLGLINPSIDSDGADVGSIAAHLYAGTVLNCYVEGGSVSGASGTGGLVGYNSGPGIIISCHSSVNVSGVSIVGGITGFNMCGASIVNCSSTGNISGGGIMGGITGCNNRSNVISCHSTGTISCNRLCGGLIGVNELSGYVSNCYSHSDVSIMCDIAGGLIGYNYMSDVINCYATGTVTGIDNLGGLIGWNDSYQTNNCFWDTTTSGRDNMCGSSDLRSVNCDNSYGKTTAEMQTQSTFIDAGWDFVGETANGTEDIWWIDEGRNYPRLWWEASD